MKWFAQLIYKIQVWLGGGWKVCVASWVAHAAVVALVILVFMLFDWLLPLTLPVRLAWFGYAVGVGYYALRELEDWLWLKHSPWWDKLGDVAAPAIVGLVICL